MVNSEKAKGTQLKAPRCEAQGRPFDARSLRDVFAEQNLPDRAWRFGPTEALSGRGDQFLGDAGRVERSALLTSCKSTFQERGSGGWSRGRKI